MYCYNVAQNNFVKIYKTLFTGYRCYLLIIIFIKWVYIPDRSPWGEPLQKWGAKPLRMIFQTLEYYDIKSTACAIIIKNIL
jgi:hypothetical protein